MMNNTDTLSPEELNYIKDLQSKADVEVANPESPYYEPDESLRHTAARSLMQSWEEQKAKAAETIRQLGPLEVLKAGLENGRISKTEFDEHQSLALTLEQHPTNHKRMTEIVYKALS